MARIFVGFCVDEDVKKMLNDIDAEKVKIFIRDCDNEYLERVFCDDEFVGKSIKSTMISIEDILLLKNHIGSIMKKLVSDFILDDVVVMIV